MIARLISAAETLPLRQALLRPNRSVAESVYPGDNDVSTFHVGVFDVDATLPAAIATLLLQDDPRCPAQPTWRLRGMAVDARRQRTGFGSAALQFAEKTARQREGAAIWCNARQPAVAFYQRHGYEPIGEIFTLPNIGPHFFCCKTLRPS